MTEPTPHEAPPKKWARVQLLLPPALKAEVTAYAADQGIAINEALRILCARGLARDAVAGSVTSAAEALLTRVRALERRCDTAEATPRANRSES